MSSLSIYIKVFASKRKDGVDIRFQFIEIQSILIVLEVSSLQVCNNLFTYRAHFEVSRQTYTAAIYMYQCCKEYWEVLGFGGGMHSLSALVIQLVVCYLAFCLALRLTYTKPMCYYRLQYKLSSKLCSFYLKICL